jgi:hypothetical protein
MGKYIVDLYIEGIGSLEIESINESEAIHKAKKLTINQALEICYVNLSKKVVWIDFRSKNELAPTSMKKQETLSPSISWISKSSLVKESKNGHH